MEKKVLLIAPVFFGYYKEIIRELELLGYEVDYICDAPSNSNISKALGRIDKRLIEGVTKKYFKRSVLPVIENIEYDEVLIIGGMTFAFSPEMICQIRNMNPNARFTLYQWDSEKNLPYSKKIHPYMDFLFSFDLSDCKRDSRYNFLPLFYTKTYSNIGKEVQKEYKYDCSYVGTAHPQKYERINKMSRQLENVMPKQFIYHYMPSKIKYLYHKLLAPEFKNAKLNNFYFDKLQIENLIDVFKNSGCILDAPQSGQTGLTIRTIECLGAKRKLITTNEDIKKYDFYNENNILVFSDEINANDGFFTSPFVEIDEDIYLKYSLREWLKTILKGN